MEKLLSRMSAQAAEDIREDLKHYVRILRTGDSTEFLDDVADELRAVSRALKFTPDHVREHAAIIEQARAAENIAGRVDEIDAAWMEAKQALSMARDAHKSAVEAAENALREARRDEMRASGDRVDAHASCNNLRRLRQTYPWLFVDNDGQPLPVPEQDRATEFLPKSIDPKMLTLSPTAVISADRLAVDFKFTSEQVASMRLPKLDRETEIPEYFGASVVSWARRASREILNRKRQSLDAERVEVTPAMRLVQNLGTVVPVDVLARAGFDLNRFDHLVRISSDRRVDTKEIFDWLARVEKRNAEIAAERQKLDAEEAALDAQIASVTNGVSPSSAKIEDRIIVNEQDHLANQRGIIDEMEQPQAKRATTRKAAAAGK